MENSFQPTKGKRTNYTFQESAAGPSIVPTRYPISAFIWGLAIIINIITTRASISRDELTVSIIPSHTRPEIVSHKYGNCGLRRKIKKGSELHPLPGNGAHGEKKKRRGGPL